MLLRTSTIQCRLVLYLLLLRVSIIGLENAKIVRYGYAIEYDYVDPTDLKHTLETKKVKNCPYFVDFVFSHACEACGHESKGGVPVGLNFFWFDE